MSVALVVEGPGTHGHRDRRSDVKPRLTLLGNRPTVENNDFARFAARILRAHGRRVADGDVAGLADLVALRSELEDAIANAVTGLRSAPWSYSWGQIGDVLGTTRQAAQQRYGTASTSEEAG